MRIPLSVSAASLPPAIVGQIYLGSVNGLTPSQAEIFDQGLSRALLGLAVVGVIGIFLLFFVLREQTKHFQACRVFSSFPCSNGSC